MLSIVSSEFQKIKRYHVLLIGIIGLALSPVLGLITQSVSIEEARNPNFDLGALINSTIWNNATIFMPVVFTLIGGYLINREYADGTLKNIFVVPVPFSKLLAGKLLFLGLLSLIWGLYSLTATIIVGICTGLQGLSISVLATGLLQMAGLSICVYIAVLPIIALCGKTSGLFMIGSIIAFVLGYCSMFFKSGVLREVYPFLASLTIIGFDTASYINAESQPNTMMGMLSLGAMLLISALLIASAKTPGETKARYGKGNISLRPAQRKRLERNTH